MAFTNTWDTAYEIEFDDDNYGYEIDNKLNKLVNMIRERMEVDHEWKNAQQDGKHKKLTLVEQSTAPTVSANEGYVYTREIGGKAELCYKDEDEKEIQLTTDGEINTEATPIFIQSTEPTGETGALWVDT